MLAYMKSVSRSDKTIEGYISDLHIFFVWLLQKANNKFFVNITKRDIISFQGYMVNTLQNSPARVRRVKSSLSALSNYIEAVCDDVYPQFRNIINKVENPPNEPVREKTVFSDDEIQKLLDYLVDKKQYQKACAVALGAFSGSRKSEIPRFKCWYFAEENIIFGSLYKTPETIKTKGRGKNGKQLNRYVLAKEFKPYLDLWMNERNELGIESDWLFVAKSENGQYEQLSSDTLNSWAISFSTILGIDFYWHALRHLFVTLLLTLNLSESVVQTILGWTSLSMVHVYDDRSQDIVLGQYFDENGIKPTSASQGINI